MPDTTNSAETDDVTTLAKVNDSPQPSAEEEAAATEREDTDTVLARMNDNPPREEGGLDDDEEPDRPSMIR